MTRRRTSLAAAFASLTALALLASACGMASGVFDMDEMHRQMHGVGERGPQTPVVSDAAAVTIEIRDYDFFPRDLTVEAGTEVTWINRDSVPHDATDGAGSWSTGMLNKGESARLTFDTPGTYQYLCTIHPDMVGTLVVQGPRSAG